MRFFDCIDLKMCVHGGRVLRKLRVRHGSLKVERAPCETIIDKEVTKYKSKMEVEVAQFALQLDRQKNKWQSIRIQLGRTSIFFLGIKLGLKIFDTTCEPTRN